MQQAKVLMLHLVMDRLQKVIWDLHQKVMEHFPYPMEDSENEPSS